jgi:type III restriction enzyme
METGTGKTYCYIKTIFELNKRYGWSKFIIVVPSIAIREGVAKSLEITAEHFLETYQKKARFFIYNSKQLHHLESFSSDAGINVMVINVQAFNATWQGQPAHLRSAGRLPVAPPIDVISANRPILILDEPQKMEGAQDLEVAGGVQGADGAALLGHPQDHAQQDSPPGRAGRLQPEAGEEDRRARHRGEGAGRHPGYLYLQSIEISSKKPPEARVELEQKLARRQHQARGRKLGKGDNLFDLSNGLDQYRDGFVVSDINANTDTLSFTNGVELTVGDATGDVNEAALRRIQIREAIKAHFDKEQALFQQGVKVLTLFFIDEVAKYRDYAQPTRRASTPASSRRNTTLPERDAGPGRDALRQVPEGHHRREDPQRLLLHRQEDQARLVDPDVASARRERGPVR